MKSTSLRTDTLADSVIILLGMTAVQRVVGFCRSILFCRWLEPDQLGQWDMAFSFLMLAAPLSVLSLSGSFGRYVEHYRQRGQLRTFLKRTAVFCVCLGVPAAAVVLAARGWFSQLLFATPEQTELVALMAGCLLTVIAMNYFIDLLNALRNVRLLAGLQFFNSLVFAVLGVCLLLYWRCTAASVVVAYGGAYVLTASAALWWLWRTWPALAQDPQPLPHRDLWSRIVPFAVWVVVASFLANLFEIADRYMIVHYSSASSAEALTLVGNYHSSRVVPLLLASIALMLGSMIMPHLSSDWEAGRRDRVCRRLNLFLKLLGFALTAGAVVVLFAAPLLFGVAFRGKFSDGLAVLPWTLTYCTWSGLTMVAHSYLWCAEKARLSSLALLIGLAVNVCLNLLLLPRMGLLGAVLATATANLVVLVLICTFNHMLGFHLDRGTRVMLALPVAICLGPWLAAAVLIVVALEAVTSDRLLSEEEKRQLADRWWQYVQRLRSLWAAWKPAQGGSR